MSQRTCPHSTRRAPIVSPTSSPAAFDQRISIIGYTVSPRTRLGCLAAATYRQSIPPSVRAFVGQSVPKGDAAGRSAGPLGLSLARGAPASARHPRSAGAAAERTDLAAFGLVVWREYAGWERGERAKYNWRAHGHPTSFMGALYNCWSHPNSETCCTCKTRTSPLFPRSHGLRSAPGR